jgi:hypothetical protein
VTPQSATAAAATEAPAEPAVAKAENNAEDDDDAKPPVTGEHVETTTESQASPSVAASYAVPFQHLFRLVH